MVACAAPAATLTGRVVGVHDGDTITVLDSYHIQYKIRLVGIDAPELKQAFGARSKQHLSALLYGQDVRVEYEKRDRYGRILGKVLTVAPCLLEPYPCAKDVNLEQIQDGMAWWYRTYAKEQSPEDRRTYDAAENVARRIGSGLWADHAPIAPWEWRRSIR